MHHDHVETSDAMEKELAQIPNAKEKFKELSNYLDTLAINDDTVNNHSYLIQVLHKAQHIFGYLPEVVQQGIALRLKLHLPEIYGVISFYSYFTTEKRGKYILSTCLGTACYVKGSQQIYNALKDELALEDGGTTTDGKFTIQGLRCVGACGIAPVLLVNEEAYGNVTPDSAKKTLKSYAAKADA